VAQKLHDNYGYSYDNLQVLLGGWNAWVGLNTTDPKGYPVITNTTPGASDGTIKGGAPVVTTTIVLVPPALAATPKP
jgi:hypothetical protein